MNILLSFCFYCVGETIGPVVSDVVFNGYSVRVVYESLPY